jgi:hypothetical protein
VKAKTKRAEIGPRSSDSAEETFAAPAVVATPPSEAGVAGSGSLALFAAIGAIGLLILGASAVPPRRIPWDVIAEPLFLYRSNIAAVGIATIALALLCLNIAVLF